MDVRQLGVGQEAVRQPFKQPSVRQAPPDDAQRLSTASETAKPEVPALAKSFQTTSVLPRPANRAFKLPVLRSSIQARTSVNSPSAPAVGTTATSGGRNANFKPPQLQAPADTIDAADITAPKLLSTAGFRKRHVLVSNSISSSPAVAQMPAAERLSAGTQPTSECAASGPVTAVQNSASTIRLPSLQPLFKRRKLGDWTATEMAAASEGARTNNALVRAAPAAMCGATDMSGCCSVDRGVLTLNVQSAVASHVLSDKVSTLTSNMSPAGIGMAAVCKATAAVAQAPTSDDQARELQISALHCKAAAVAALQTSFTSSPAVFQAALAALQAEQVPVQYPASNAVAAGMPVRHAIPLAQDEATSTAAVEAETGHSSFSASVTDANADLDTPVETCQQRNTTRQHVQQLTQQQQHVSGSSVMESFEHDEAGPGTEQAFRAAARSFNTADITTPATSAAAGLAEPLHQTQLLKECMQPLAQVPTEPCQPSSEAPVSAAAKAVMIPQSSSQTITVQHAAAGITQDPDNSTQMVTKRPSVQAAAGMQLAPEDYQPQMQEVLHSCGLEDTVGGTVHAAAAAGTSAGFALTLTAEQCMQAVLPASAAVAAAATPSAVPAAVSAGMIGLCFGSGDANDCEHENIQQLHAPQAAAVSSQAAESAVTAGAGSQHKAMHRQQDQHTGTTAVAELEGRHQGSQQLPTHQDSITELAEPAVNYATFTQHRAKQHLMQQLTSSSSSATLMAEDTLLAKPSMAQLHDAGCSEASEHKDVMMASAGSPATAALSPAVTAQYENARASGLGLRATIVNAAEPVANSACMGGCESSGVCGSSIGERLLPPSAQELLSAGDIEFNLEVPGLAELAGKCPKLRPPGQLLTAAQHLAAATCPELVTLQHQLTRHMMPRKLEPAQQQRDSGSSCSSRDQGLCRILDVKDLLRSLLAAQQQQQQPQCPAEEVIGAQETYVCHGGSSWESASYRNSCYCSSWVEDSKVDLDRLTCDDALPCSSSVGNSMVAHAAVNAQAGFAAAVRKTRLQDCQQLQCIIAKPAVSEAEEHLDVCGIVPAAGDVVDPDFMDWDPWYAGLAALVEQ